MSERPFYDLMNDIGDVAHFNLVEYTKKRLDKATEDTPDACYYRGLCDGVMIGCILEKYTSETESKGKNANINK